MPYIVIDIPQESPETKKARRQIIDLINKKKPPLQVLEQIRILLET